MSRRPRSASHAMMLAVTTAIAIAGCQSAPPTWNPGGTTSAPASDRAVRTPSVAAGVPQAGPRLTGWRAIKPLAQRLASSGRGVAGAAQVKVKADLSALLGLRGGRKLLALGFADTGLIDHYVLRAEGLDMDPAEATIAVGTTSAFAGDATITVAAGKNRLFTLEAHTLADDVVGRIRTVASIAVGDTAPVLEFNYATDAAGRILENLVFYVEPARQVGNATYTALRDTDMTGALKDYVQHFTSYDPLTNAFTGVNPLYFKDWPIAAYMVDQADPMALAAFANPAATSAVPDKAGDVSLEGRHELFVRVFDPANPDTALPPTEVVLLDPVNRDGKNALNTGVAQDFSGGLGTFHAVPPGRWQVRVHNGTGTMIGELSIGRMASDGPQIAEIAFTPTSSANAAPIDVHPYQPAPKLGGLKPLALHEVATYAGSVQGAQDETDRLHATFTRPHGLFVEGDYLFVADTGNNKIRKIYLYDGHVHTFSGAGGPGGHIDGTSILNVTYNAPVTIFGQSGFYVVGDQGNTGGRLINLGGDLVSDIGNMSGYVQMTGVVKYADGHYVAVDRQGGDTLYHYNSDGFFTGLAYQVPNHVNFMTLTGDDLLLATDHDQIFRVNSALNNQALLGGTYDGEALTDGASNVVRFHDPHGVCFDPESQTIWVADTGNNAIREMRLTDTGYVTTTIAGGGAPGNAAGIGSAAHLNRPIGIAYYQGYVFFSDTENNRIRVVRVK